MRTHFQPHMAKVIALHVQLFSSQIPGVRFSWKLQHTACTNTIPNEQRKLSLNVYQQLFGYRNLSKRFFFFLNAIPTEELTPPHKAVSTQEVVRFTFLDTFCFFGSQNLFGQLIPSKCGDASKRKATDSFDLGILQELTTTPPFKGEITAAGQWTP